jgi:hypothetical protein
MQASHRGRKGGAGQRCITLAHDGDVEAVGRRSE